MTEKNSFEALVAGISRDERIILLEKLKTSAVASQIQTLESPEENIEDDRSLQIKLESESFLYKFFLWLRTIFSSKTKEEMYNNDCVLRIARQVQHRYPGLIDFQNKTFGELFYGKLNMLHESSDFFRPYISIFNEAQGDFYVFLSTFVAPEIAESINQDADPYTIPFDRPVSSETRISLTRKLDAAIRNMLRPSKEKMYEAIRTLEWLRQFTLLPFLHFLAQFTTVAQEEPTCPFVNAELDWQAFAKVLSNGMTVSHAVLEALFLFVSKKTSHIAILDPSNGKALNEFMKNAMHHFSVIQTVISTVPSIAIGKIIFNDAAWQCESFGGAEDWSIRFRGRWKEIFDERWNSWLRDRKKHQLVELLTATFNVSEFPELPSRPWENLWRGIEFHGETTAGFLVWFTNQKAPSILLSLHTLLMEGVFLKNENRTEFAEALNEFTLLTKKIEAFAYSLSPRGSIGQVFDAASQHKHYSLKEQDKIDAVMINAEAQVHNFSTAFCNCCRTFENIFHGIFDEIKDSQYESLQNLMTVHGRENGKFRAELQDIRRMLNGAKTLISELEPLDLPRQEALQLNVDFHDS